MTILRDATAINDGTTAIMAVSLRNHGDNGGRCHCGLCCTSTAVVPRLRCDGGIRSLKVLYTLPPGRPVHSDTNSASLGSNSHAEITRND